MARWGQRRTVRAVADGLDADAELMSVWGNFGAPTASEICAVCLFWCLGMSFMKRIFVKSFGKFSLAMKSRAENF